MAYSFRFLSTADRAVITKRVTTPPAATLPDETTQLAWESDLAAHQALLAVATDDDAKASHKDAIKALEQALTKAAALSR